MDQPNVYMVWKLIGASCDKQGAIDIGLDERERCGYPCFLKVSRIEDRKTVDEEEF